MRGWLVIAALAACAPRIAGPVEQQRASDQRDESRLATQLDALPGVVHAAISLHRAVIDPFTQARAPGAAAVTLVVDDRADQASLSRAARALVHAIAPDVPPPEVAILVGARRTELARLGPFTIASSSKPRLLALLAAVFALLALCAGWIAWRERPRPSSS